MPKTKSSRDRSSPQTSQKGAAMMDLCRSNRWDAVLAHVQNDPTVGTTLMIMDNQIATTLIHQAINSKSDAKVRAQVILTILKLTPEAAAIRNGYGSLPLHVICQRNTKLDSTSKKQLILAFLEVYPKALLLAGGVGQRTPLHIIFTDYTSPTLVQTMIDMGPGACWMRDKNGWLPIMVACSRHCSPEKLRMLLKVYPESLYATTPDGETLLDLATTRATKSHPNHALINELRQAMKETCPPSFLSATLQQPHSLQGGRNHASGDAISALDRRDDQNLVDRDLHEPIMDWSTAQTHSSSLGDSGALANLLLHLHRSKGADDDEEELGSVRDVQAPTQQPSESGAQSSSSLSFPDDFDGEIAAV